MIEVTAIANTRLEFKCDFGKPGTYDVCDDCPNRFNCITSPFDVFVVEAEYRKGKYLYVLIPSYCPCFRWCDYFPKSPRSASSYHVAYRTMITNKGFLLRWRIF